MSAAQNSAGTGSTRKMKLALLGDSGTGKSSLVVRLCKDEFVTSLHSTVGSSFFKYSVNLDQPVDKDGINSSSGGANSAAASNNNSSSPNMVHLDIWDTAGQERFKSLARMYYRGAAAVVVVYDVTSVETFERAKGWVKELQAQENCLITLVGNKIDLEDDRAVPRDEALAFAKEHDIECYESSAKSGKGVQNIFYQIAVKLSKSAKAPMVPVGGVRGLGAPGSAGGASPAPKKDCPC